MSHPALRELPLPRGHHQVGVPAPGGGGEGHMTKGLYFQVMKAEKRTNEDSFMSFMDSFGCAISAFWGSGCPCVFKLQTFHGKGFALQGVEHVCTSQREGILELTSLLPPSPISSQPPNLFTPSYQLSLSSSPPFSLLSSYLSPLFSLFLLSAPSFSLLSLSLPLSF